MMTIGDRSCELSSQSVSTINLSGLRSKGRITPSMSVAISASRALVHRGMKRHDSNLDCCWLNYGRKALKVEETMASLVLSR